MFSFLPTFSTSHPICRRCCSPVRWSVVRQSSFVVALRAAMCGSRRRRAWRYRRCGAFFVWIFTSMPESAVSITHLAPSLLVEPCDAIDVEQQGVVCEPGGNNRGAWLMRCSAFRFRPFRFIPPLPLCGSWSVSMLLRLYWRWRTL